MFVYAACAAGPLAIRANLPTILTDGFDAAACLRERALLSQHFGATRAPCRLPRHVTGDGHFVRRAA